MSKKIALICGGPSPERGISLNSARSVMDHLMAIHDIVPFYVDQQKNFYQLDPALLYSNTPSDFDFKLNAGSVFPGVTDSSASCVEFVSTGTQEKELDPGSQETLSQQSCQMFHKVREDRPASIAGSSRSVKLSTKQLINTLKTFDLVFPAIHGDFGETGELQALLEKHQIPFVGCSSEACLNMYYKDRAALVLKQAGYDTLPSITVGSVFPGVTDSSALCVESVSTGIQEKELDPDVRQDDKQRNLVGNDTSYIGDKIRNFFTQHNITRAVVKPIAGGSSIGVHSVTSADQAIAIASEATVPMLIEPFCEGREFTVIVLQNPAREPVALVPTEIQISYEGGAIFDYRRKYLPTSNTMWACPSNFPDDVIQKIRTDAEAIFRLFKMRDFARLDGWVMNDGRILFTDMNPISGMEQNSFIFQQTSRMGMTHQEALEYVVGR